ncbi:MAG: phosphodiesterase YaeI [Verrucomicrobia bacterium]|nr:phosphodiesterase YaeI [Verrucomicrobiota bacterium]
MKLSRRSFLTTLASLPILGAIFAAYIRFFEPNWIEVTWKNLRISHLKSSIRALHLSDFHVSEVVSLSAVEKAIDLALEQHPQVAFLTGDFITWKLDNKPEYLRILKKLSEVTPTFACVGNHDGGIWAGSSHGYKDSSNIQNFLASAGIHCLVNRSMIENINGQTLEIAGLGDIWSREAKPESVLQKQRPHPHPIIVLSHNPDSKERLKEFDWDLALCGHTHGGQFVVPLLGIRPFLPVRDKSFPEGVLTWGKRHIHISRGVGNLHGLRFNCRPEISFLNLTS